MVNRDKRWDPLNMKVQEQEDLEIDLLLNEIPHMHHYHHHHHHVFHGDTHVADGDLHIHHGMYWASSRLQRARCGLGGGGGTIRHADTQSRHLPPPFPISSGLSPSSGSASPPSGLSPAIHAMIGRREEQTNQESNLVNRFRCWYLANPKQPNPIGSGAPPAAAASCSAFVNSPVDPSSFHSGASQCGYDAGGNPKFPLNSVIGEKVYLPPQQQWLNNLTYGVMEIGENGGFVSSTDRPFPTYKVETDPLWNDSLGDKRVQECGKGCMLIMATQKCESQWLQRELSKGKDNVDMIFNCVIHHASELMINASGNYLMQKLFEVCSQEQLMQILIVLKGSPKNLISISLDMHGTRAVQKLIDSVKTRQQTAMVISAIQPGFLDLIKDLNGSHVLQQCLRSFTAEDNKFIFEAAARHCVDIATHKHGCCVLQKCIAHSTGADKEKLLQEISANGYKIAQDPFGNYVVQYILGLENPLIIQNLISQFKGKYVHLSSQKFSSNVVERCLEIFAENDQETIIRELISFSRFDQLMEDPFANYVIQSALQNVKNDSLYDKLRGAVLLHEADLKSNPYCKRIFQLAIMKR
ncbi:hypothetical protein Cni_G06341 [Canna indica]|uniref:PUM-HD domain-containing protein n=1 Tax=Canna indica TaxID=4628 RepID=A0AAQ3JYC3_9LILI|nr:hypothetical protein Cni_G06341 [Canna indica]